MRRRKERVEIFSIRATFWMSKVPVSSPAVGMIGDCIGLAFAFAARNRCGRMDLERRRNSNETRQHSCCRRGNTNCHETPLNYRARQKWKITADENQFPEFRFLAGTRSRAGRLRNAFSASNSD